MEQNDIKIEDESIKAKLDDLNLLNNEIESVIKEARRLHKRFKKLEIIAKGKKFEILDEVRLTYCLPDNSSWKVDIEEGLILFEEDVPGDEDDEGHERMGRIADLMRRLFEED